MTLLALSHKNKLTRKHDKEIKKDYHMTSKSIYFMQKT